MIVVSSSYAIQRVHQSNRQHHNNKKATTTAITKTTKTIKTTTTTTTTTKQKQQQQQQQQHQQPNNTNNKQQQQQCHNHYIVTNRKNNTRWSWPLSRCMQPVRWLIAKRSNILYLASVKLPFLCNRGSYPFVVCVDTCARARPFQRGDNRSSRPCESRVMTI